MTDIIDMEESVDTVSLETWTNKSNIDYYEQVPPSVQSSFAEKGGLASHCDLERFSTLIHKATSILEVGACYGRVLDYVKTHNPSAKIVSIERSSKFYHILRNKYEGNVDILHTDLFDFHYNQSFDLILWMWSGLSDFSKKEQLLAIKLLLNYLGNNGTLVIDTFSHSAKPKNAEFSEQQAYIIKVNEATLFGYIPSPNEMTNYAKKLNATVKYEPYLTICGRPRALYYFRNIGFL